MKHFVDTDLKIEHSNDCSGFSEITTAPNGPASLKPSSNTMEQARKPSPLPPAQQYAQTNHTSAAKISLAQPVQPAKPAPATGTSPMQPSVTTSLRAPPQIERDNYSEPEPPPKPVQPQQQRFMRGPATQQPSAFSSQAPSSPPNGAPSASYLSQPQRPSTVVNPANCDISMMDTTDRMMGSTQLRPQESLGGFGGQRNPRGRSPMMMMSQQPQQQQQQQQQQPSNFRQQPNRPSNFDDVMMPQRGPEASGGYNFQRVMDDHFEHYKRPPSRERSVDLTNLPTSLVEAKTVRSSRPPSR